MRRRFRHALAAVCLIASPALASAALISDPTGDFLATYTGPKGGDLDVVSASVTYNPATQVFGFFARLAAAVGTTPASSGAAPLYIWGVDRGQGTERFVSGTPSIGSGVFFDSVLVVTAAGAGTVNRLLPTPTTSTTLGAGAVSISGTDIFATVPLTALPTLGRDPLAYTWNFWPRFGQGNNAQISDFAPDARNEAVSAVPEPGTYALLGLGLALLAGISRRSSRN